MQLDYSVAKSHIQRVRSSVQQTVSLKEIPGWIEKNTFIKGEHYSFKHHEFQEFIISQEDEEVNVQKCSQIGLSEIMARWVFGVAYNFPSFSTVITFPFSGDAENFARTRVDPFIASSPMLREAMNSDLNNSEMKQVKESLVYFRGTNGKTAAISIPADMIVSDEIDRSNPGILTQYTSRLTHSPYKWRRNFSTPTVNGMGIAKLMQTSRRHVNMCKCNHCNEWFHPNFFDHVRIPGYDGEIKLLNKNTLPRTRFLEAQLHCPRCGGLPSLWPEHRRYVVENNDATHLAKGIFVSPFDAPAIITPVTLLKAMVRYTSISEFINQNLGLTSEDASESLTLADILAAETTDDLMATGVHCMGADMGVICHIVIGRMQLDGTLLVVHREKVHISEFEKRRLQLKARFKVAVSVFDSQPYTDIIMRLQKTDKNLFGGVYLETKRLEVVKVQMFDGDLTSGKMPIHQAQINRDPAFDELMGLFKLNQIKIAMGDPELNEEFQKHLLDMKRLKMFDQNGEPKFRWVKQEDAVDHFHHALLYLHMACKLRSTVAREGQNLPLGGAIPFVKNMAVTQLPRDGIRGIAIRRP